MTFTNYVTTDKDRWDLIANKAYGDPMLGHLIIAYNADVSILSELPGGLTLKIPIRTDPITGNDLPPWATDEDDTVENPDQTDPNIPVNPAPIVELAFAPGYPVKEGNKIKFAINKSGTYPYTIKTLAGVVISSSPAYLFTAGFPILSPDITQAGIYLVEVGSIVSGQITMPGTTVLAFSTTPFYYRDGSADSIRYAINKEGSYRVKAIRLVDNVTVYDSLVLHAVDEIISIPVSGDSEFRLEVDTLQATVSVNQSCDLIGRRPTFFGDPLSATDTQVIFRFDAQNVERMHVWIERQGTVLRETELVLLSKATPQDITNANLPGRPVQFFTSNTVTFEFDSLEPQPFLELKLTGKSCSSPTDTRPLTLISSVLAFDNGYPRVVNNALEIRVNRPQAYLTTVKNETTDVTYLNESHTYTVGQSFIVPDLPNGYYTVTVGGISASVEVESGSGPGPVDPVGAEPIGAYSQEVAGRTYTWIGKDGFTCTINPDGTLTDNTPGVNHSGTYTTQDGRNVYYMIGYSIWGDTAPNGTKTYRKFVNVFLPSQEMGRVYTIKRFVMLTGMSFAQFVSELNNGINKDTALLTELPMSISNTSDPVNRTNWVKASRHLRSGYFGASIPATGRYGSYSINAHDTPENLQAKGINTSTQWGSWTPQPKTFTVFKWYPDGDIPSRSALNSWGRSHVINYSLDKRSAYWEEVVENTQGNDPDIDSKLPSLYEGVRDQMRVNDPDMTILESSIMGPYGYDTYLGFFSRFQLEGTYAHYVDVMSTHLHWITNPSTGAWAHVSTYFLYNHIGSRNFNFNLYLYNEVFHLPLLVLSIHEKAKKASKTYGGIDRERKVGFVTATSVQSMVNGPNGNGVENGVTRDIIPFPNGVMVTKNLVPASVWDEMFISCFYIILTGNDFGMWGGWEVGTNINRINKLTWFPQQLEWRPNSGGSEDFVPGRNGAPQLSAPGDGGLETFSQTNPADASYAAFNWVMSFMNSTSKVYWAEFTSDKYSYTPVAGSSGLHLNGFGPLNTGGYNEKLIFDAKTGLALVCVTGADVYAIYTNSFLSQHEYEEDVVVTYDGDSVNLGRCYGRGIYVKKF